MEYRHWHVRRRRGVPALRIRPLIREEIPNKGYTSNLAAGPAANLTGGKVSPSRLALCWEI